MTHTLLESDRQYVLGITRRILRDADLAADAAQDALLSAHRRRDQFAARSAYRTWLYQIAVFAALSRLRWLRSTRLAIGVAVPDVADSSPSPEDALIDRERLAHVEDCLAKVPASLRQVLLLRAEGHSVPEIAHSLQISVANVKVRTHRAREHLRLALAEVRAGRTSRKLGGSLAAITILLSIGACHDPTPLGLDSGRAPDAAAPDAAIAGDTRLGPDARAVDATGVDALTVPGPFAAGHAIETPFADGRSCLTCHVPDLGFSITPAYVEARYEADPDDPLFRDVDRDADGSFTTLRRTALFNVTLPLPSNVVDLDHPGATTITVRRAVPTLYNLYLKPGPFLDDGRAATLADQVVGAVANHMETDAPLTPGFIADVVASEDGLFSDPTLSAAAQQAPANGLAVVTIPLATSSSQLATGRNIFSTRCGSPCHSDPETNYLGASTGEQLALHTDQISERNLAGLPVLHLSIDGQPVTTPDPGAFGQPQPDEFVAPSLRGLSQTAPYFHDNSVATLDGVIDHYESISLPTLGASDRAALLAYLQAL